MGESTVGTKHIVGMDFNPSFAIKIAKVCHFDPVPIPKPRDKSRKVKRKNNCNNILKSTHYILLLDFKTRHYTMISGKLAVIWLNNLMEKQNLIEVTCL